MPFYEKGNIRIYYEEAGSGFPLLAYPSMTAPLGAPYQRRKEEVVRARFSKLSVNAAPLSITPGASEPSSLPTLRWRKPDFELVWGFSCQVVAGT
jgi:hypothetical protein